MHGFPFPHTLLGENPAPGQRNKHPSSVIAQMELGADLDLPTEAASHRAPPACARPGGCPRRGPRSAEPAAGLPVPIPGAPGLTAGRGCWQRHSASCEPCPGEAACQRCRWFEGKSKQRELLTRV